MAAGRGERLGRPENKAFVTLGGKPLVWYALGTLRGCREIGGIVVVVAPGDVERARGLLRGGGGRTERVVAGGEERQDSVRAGLAEVPPETDLVLIHDAARPFLGRELVGRCLEAGAAQGAVVAALPAADTIKEVGRDGAVAATLDRERLWIVQTPQVFRRRLLVEAHEAAAREGVRGTDDASLIERLGYPVHVVRGDPENAKITYPEDVARAERALSHRGDTAWRECEARSGIGYDAHPFAEDRPLVLAGVRFAGERGLVGHSDADVVCHAICDALLGAIGGGDIGQHFPDSDPAYAGVSSLSLLARVAEMVRDAGWRIENADAIVIAEAPRIADRIGDMRRALAQAMGVEVPRVNVKGKTTEGMGFTGRREGIASEAIVLLHAADRGQGRTHREEREC